MVQVNGIQLYYNNFENTPFRERSYLVDKKKVCIRVAKGLPTPPFPSPPGLKMSAGVSL